MILGYQSSEIFKFMVEFNKVVSPYVKIGAVIYVINKLIKRDKTFSAEDMIAIIILVN